MTKGESSGEKSEAALAKQRLFICCDGTWQDGINISQPLTNVSRLARCVKSSTEDGYKQIVYYDSGVGSGTDWGANNVDGTLGRGIGAKIRDAYSFLCLNYSPGDEIFLIGFSRGAFTVQCVASMIHQIGLLEKAGLEALPDLYGIWADQSYKGPTNSSKDKDPSTPSKDKSCSGSSESSTPIIETLSDAMSRSGLVRRKIEIKACAVWDTVSALGLRPRPLKFVGKCVPIRAIHAYQALALNEHRRSFKPLVWSSRNAETKVRQCWFIGAHSDVGGGNDNPDLEMLSLIWMVAQLATIDESIEMFDHAMLLHYMNPKYLGLEEQFNALLGKDAAKLTVSSGRTTGKLVTKLAPFWWLFGVKSRGKYLTRYKGGPSDNSPQEKDQEVAPLGDEDKPAGTKGKCVTRDEDTSTEVKGDGDTSPGHDKLKVENLPSSTQLIHFSVRLMMARRREKCHILRRWASCITDDKNNVSWKGGGDPILEDVPVKTETEILMMWSSTSKQAGESNKKERKWGRGQKKEKLRKGKEADKKGEGKQAQVEPVEPLHRFISKHLEKDQFFTAMYLPARQDKEVQARKAQAQMDQAQKDQAQKDQAHMDQVQKNHHEKQIPEEATLEDQAQMEQALKD